MLGYHLFALILFFGYSTSFRPLHLGFSSHLKIVYFNDNVTMKTYFRAYNNISKSYNTFEANNIIKGDMNISKGGKDISKGGKDISECGKDISECGKDISECGKDISECGKEMFEIGGYGNDGISRNVYNESDKMIVIPYVTEYPHNPPQFGDVSLGFGGDRWENLGFFKEFLDLGDGVVLDKDERGMRERIFSEIIGRNGKKGVKENMLNQLSLEDESDVWKCMRIGNVYHDAVTKSDVKSSPVTFASPSREDVESVRKRLVIGRARIHWFPRYFGKSLQEISDYIKLCDIILDVRDARIPHISDGDYMLNVYNNMFTHKPRILVFTHADLASIKGTEDWGHYYRIKEYRHNREFNKNILDPNSRKLLAPVVFVNAREGGKGIITLKKLIYKMCERVRERRARRGFSPRPTRAIVLGIPNVGKSALINRLIGRHRARSFNATGVTREIRWVRLHPDEYREAVYKVIDVIDTPGVLPPNLYRVAIPRNYKAKRGNPILGQLYLDLPDTGVRGGHSKSGIDALPCKIERGVYLLAAANQIVEGAYEVGEVAEALLEQMLKIYRLSRDYLNIETLLKRVGLGRHPEILEAEYSEFSHQCLQHASHNHCGGDYNAASLRILNDFRKGRLGRVTLQIPPQIETFEDYCLSNAKNLKMTNQKIDYSRGVYEGW